MRAENSHKDGGIIIRAGFHPALSLAIALSILLFPVYSYASDADETLPGLVKEALSSSPSLKAMRERVEAQGFRPQSEGSLPDPMVMVGYQNEGYESVTYGEMEGSQIMLSVSQMFPYFGKRGIQKSMAEKDLEALMAEYRMEEFSLILEVEELYYDIYNIRKTVAIIEEQSEIFKRLETIALASYSSGMGTQEDAIMIQSQKYMLMERAEMMRQREKSLSAKLNAVLGREPGAALRFLSEPPVKGLYEKQDALSGMAYASPELLARKKMTEAAGLQVEMARKEFYPDFTLAANLYDRKDMDDMASLTLSMNIPLYARSNKTPVLEKTKAEHRAASTDEDAALKNIKYEIAENYFMAESAGRLMGIYRDALIPKTRQAFEAGLASYESGRGELMRVITTLTSLKDYEISYIEQFTGQQKAIARIEAMLGRTSFAGGVSDESIK